MNRVEIWLMRHGPQEKTDDASVWQPSAPLSTEGVVAIKKVAKAHLATQNFRLVAGSPFRRAIMTAETMRPRGYIERIRELAPRSMTPWEHIFKVHPRHQLVYNPAGFYCVEPGLMVAEGEWVWNGILRIVYGLGHASQALLVSHQPLIEAAVAFGTNEWPPKWDMKKGEILVLTFEDKKLTDIRHLPLPE